jgi:MoaA/NifB/PqqE/SkfB family radical SAM enzyme
MTRPLFLFYQFGGDNTAWCNQTCPYCYAPQKRMVQLWQGPIEKWEAAFERLNRDIYFNLSYGESMGQDGFYDVLDMIGRHENWEASLITNLSMNPEQMLNTKLAEDKRLYVHASWHPLGGGDWPTFQKHLLMLQDADIKTIVMYLWYPPQIKDWKKYFEWFDAHNIRTCVRRFIGEYQGRYFPRDYYPKNRAYLEAQVLAKTHKYGLDIVPPKGNLCSALKDMILVAYDGRVSLCADVPDWNLGNIFDPKFKLNMKPIRCPSQQCGGDYGLLHFEDEDFTYPPTDELWHDCFVAQVEQITGGGKEPVVYPNRVQMEKWLKGGDV